MRIQEVCDQTGLSKRNVHFYIKERLIAPAVNKSNGYYNFSENDCKRLIMIHELRNAGLSLSVIRSILNTPTCAGYYLRLHTNQLRKEILHLEHITKSLNRILERLPVNPDFDTLYNLGTSARIPQPITDKNLESLENYDNNLVNQFLWRFFLPEGNLTEYQQYLWEKVNRITNVTTNQDYQKINLFLQSLSQKEIDYFFVQRNQVFSFIAELDATGCKQYVEKMKGTLRAFLKQNHLINSWKNCYETYIYPNTRIYDSEINTMISEMSPLFADYAHNIHIICDSLYCWLHSDNGAELLHNLMQTLDGYLNLEHSHHGELAALDSFDQMGF